MNILQVRSLVIVLLLFLIKFAQSGPMKSSSDSNEDNNEGHELIMTIEEPIEEPNSTPTVVVEELVDDFDDFELKNDQELYEKLITSDLNIPVVNLDFKNMNKRSQYSLDFDAAASNSDEDY